MKYREAKTFSVDGDLSVSASTSQNGQGWYVTFNSVAFNYWLYPSEAKKMAKFLLKLSRKPKSKVKK